AVGTVGQRVEAWVVRGPVERRVVFEVEGAELWIADRVELVGDPDGRLLRRDRLQQDPAVALHLYRSLADAELMQPVEVVGDLRGDEQPVAGAELDDSLAGAQEFRHGP